MLAMHVELNLSERSIDLSTALIRCPNCGSLGPNSRFCINCGIDKDLEDSEALFQDHLVQDLDEPVEEVEEPEVEIEDKILHDDRSIDELDSKVKENMVDLKKSLGLIIWLVDLYLKGNVEKEHLNQYLNAYEYRLDQCLKHRSLMLEISKDQKQIETALNWAKLNLIEYKMKMKIGDISDEEYNLKVPVYEWDIKKYEHEMAKRRSEIQFLEDITHVMPKEEVDEFKKIAINSQKTIQEQKKSGIISQQTADRIKNILNRTLDVLKNPNDRS